MYRGSVAMRSIQELVGRHLLATGTLRQIGSSTRCKGGSCRQQERRTVLRPTMSTITKLIHVNNFSKFSRPIPLTTFRADLNWSVKSFENCRQGLVFSGVAVVQYTRAQCKKCTGRLQHMNGNQLVFPALVIRAQTLRHRCGPYEHQARTALYSFVEYSKQQSNTRHVSKLEYIQSGCAHDFLETASTIRCATTKSSTKHLQTTVQYSTTVTGHTLAEAESIHLSNCIH